MNRQIHLRFKQISRSLVVDQVRCINRNLQLGIKHSSCSFLRKQRIGLWIQCRKLERIQWTIMPTILWILSSNNSWVKELISTISKVIALVMTLSKISNIDELVSNRNNIYYAKNNKIFIGKFLILSSLKGKTVEGTTSFNKGFRKNNSTTKGNNIYKTKKNMMM